MTALRVIGLRLLKSVRVILAILALSVLLIRIAPGDPVMAGQAGVADETFVRQLRAQFGLDQLL